MCVFIFIIRWTDRLADGHTASGGAKTDRAMLDLERENGKLDEIKNGSR